jgi:glyoxylase-like metal-dependent hydrolase (beta-lactamase superfamily II)
MRASKYRYRFSTYFWREAMHKNGVYLTGTGTCRISQSGQNSGCVIMDNTTLVIDAGAQSLDGLVSVGGLDDCETLHIHLSHRHTDHISGLLQLLQCLTWSDDRRHLQVRQVYIHGTDEVCRLIQDFRKVSGENETDLAGNYPDSGRTLEFCPGPDFEDWTYRAGELKIHSVHLPGVNNHGIKFSLDDKRYAFTADATEMNDGLVSFCRDADVVVFDFGHISNVKNTDGSFRIDLTHPVDLAVRSDARNMYATHIYLRHLEHRILSAEERKAESEHIVSEMLQLAREKGFSGNITIGENLARI